MSVSVETLMTIVRVLEVLLGVCIIPMFVFIYNLANGVKCQLRNDMLHIYYQYKDAKKIRQYELENFVYLYRAYKSLRGNSFIDKIYKEVMTFEVTT